MRKAFLMAVLSVLCAVWAQTRAAAPAAPAVTTLRGAARGHFLIGAAVEPETFADPRQRDVVATQFDCVTAGNSFKPDFTEPQPGHFTFERADAIAAFAAAHKQVLIGHTLCWHSQTPAWFYQAADGKPLPREQGLANLKRHIEGVIGRFRGKVRGWDVVNEVIDDGDRYLRDTPARKSIGDDYIVQAFRIAHAADPDAELYYNDYNIELPGKREKALRLVHELKAAGVRLDAVGIQGHWLLDFPKPAVIDEAIGAFAAMGVKVNVTELDVDVLPRKNTTADVQAREQGGHPADNPYVDGCPESVLRQQADRYAAIFRVFLKHPGVIDRVTLWGVTDGDSWLNNFPIRGRTNYPLLFDRQGRPKPAFDAVMSVLR